MRRARRADSERKRRLVLAVTDAQLEAGRHPTIAGVARQAGVGRKFIYDHPDLRAGIELKAAQVTGRRASNLVASAGVTGASLRADLENTRAQNHRLNKQIRARGCTGPKAHAACCRRTPSRKCPRKLADQQLAAWVAELDQQLFEARENLRRTAEELEAARAIDRELMEQANRPPPAILVTSPSSRQQRHPTGGVTLTGHHPGHRARKASAATGRKAMSRTHRESVILAA